jgi:hypothetical protein
VCVCVRVCVCACVCACVCVCVCVLKGGGDACVARAHPHTCIPCAAHDACLSVTGRAGLTQHTWMVATATKLA